MLLPYQIGFSAHASTCVRSSGSALKALYSAGCSRHTARDSGGARVTRSALIRATGKSCRTRASGTPRKLMDVARMRSAGWQARTALEDGLRVAHAEFAAHTN